MGPPMLQLSVRDGPGPKKLKHLKDSGRSEMWLVVALLHLASPGN
jgi:hypothetical protein